MVFLKPLMLPLTWSPTDLSSQVHTDLLLRVTTAPTLAALGQTLIEGIPGLVGLTLWDADDLAVTSAGIPMEASAAPVMPLLEGSDYGISTAPDLQLPPELLAVIDLRLRYFAAQQQIDTLSAQLSSLTAAAHTDALTGLPNRHAFERDLNELAASNDPFAVVFLDLDGFKGINDQHGHALGDSLLKGYGLWLVRVTGPWGRVYRMGGDEYLLLVTHFPGSAEDLQRWAQERLPVPFVDGVSASLGIAWRHEREAISDVLRLADQRMYQAKGDRPRTARQMDRRLTHSAGTTQGTEN
ncbi:GGDEF domain-containing protein [Deinococcus navajonensis]|uniref:GGDEF domain-containing protein n=1 Tax=Deinococcus navajonensis TaxID=309884 RepID=A0ABV8XQ46_9DEIO